MELLVADPLRASVCVLFIDYAGLFGHCSQFNRKLDDKYT